VGADTADANVNFSVSVEENTTASEEFAVIATFAALIAENVNAADQIMARLKWELIVDAQSAGWTTISNIQTATWQNVDSSAGSGWQTIDTQD
jgi:hypothetical protein